MEPRQEGLSRGAESIPVQGAEYSAGVSVERQLSNNPEVGHQSRPEVGAVQAEAAQVAMPALPTPVVSDPANAQALQSDDDTPIIANDDDLIEKEWVDKAKKIIAETKDDPYKREKEVSKLQIEYIRRRYGREIGESVD